MTNRSRTAAKLAGAVGVLGLLAALLGLVPAASAAPNNVEYRLTSGDVVIGENNPLVLPTAGSGFIGTWDDATGDVEGNLQIPTFQITLSTEIAPGTFVDVVADVTFSALTPLSGNIDPATGFGTVQTTLSVEIKLVTVNGGPIDATCTMEPVVVNYEVEAPNPPFDANNLPQNLALAADGFDVPSATCTGEAAPLVQGPLNTNLGLPTDDTSSDLALELGTIPPPDTLPTTTTTTAPTTSTTVAPATRPAQAVRAQPRVTG